jgi:hypothetical protein
MKKAPTAFSMALRAIEHFSATEALLILTCFLSSHDTKANIVCNGCQEKSSLFFLKVFPPITAVAKGVWGSLPVFLVLIGAPVALRLVVWVKYIECLI